MAWNLPQLATIIIYLFFHDKTQEHNTEEHKDRIPCVALRCDERQREGDAT